MCTQICLRRALLRSHFATTSSSGQTLISASTLAPVGTARCSPGIDTSNFLLFAPCWPSLGDPLLDAVVYICSCESPMLLLGADDKATKATAKGGTDNASVKFSSEGKLPGFCTKYLAKYNGWAFVRGKNTVDYNVHLQGCKQGRCSRLTGRAMSQPCSPGRSQQLPGMLP